MRNFVSTLVHWMIVAILFTAGFAGLIRGRYVPGLLTLAISIALLLPLVNPKRRR